MKGMGIVILMAMLSIVFFEAGLSKGLKVVQNQVDKVSSSLKKEYIKTLKEYDNALSECLEGRK